MNIKRIFLIILILLMFSGPSGVALALYPNDTDIGQARASLDMVNIGKAWDITTGSKDIIIAIIDDGVAMDHPDLINNIWKNEREFPGNNKDDDGNGYIDDVYGWDFSVSTYGPISDLSYFPGTIDDEASVSKVFESLLGIAGITWEELSAEGRRYYLRDVYFNHGTAVAGVIGAEGNNTRDIAGVMWNVRLMNLPVFELWESYQGISTTDPYNAVAEAVRYATRNGAHIINLSLSSGFSSDLYFALQEAYDAGVVIIAAAGNGESVERPDGSTAIEGYDLGVKPLYPVCSPYVLGVGSLSRRADRRFAIKSSFSNYGSCVDIAGPGEEINTLYFGYDVKEIEPWQDPAEATIFPTTLWTQPSGRKLSVQSIQGTSFSAPLVAGIAGLLKTLNPYAQPQEIYDRLTGTMFTNFLNNSAPRVKGLVDAEAALLAGPINTELKEGDLIRGENTTTVYLLEDGKRRNFNSVSDLISLEYNPQQIKVVSDGYIQRLIPGASIEIEQKIINNPNISEGAIIRAQGDFDVWIVKYMGNKAFKRLVLSPAVFNSYGHLKWEDIQDVPRSTVDSFITADLVRVVGESQIYKLIPQGDTGVRQPISDVAIARLGLDNESIYEINDVDRGSYTEGASIE